MKLASQMLETTEHLIFEDDEVKKAIVQPVLEFSTHSLLEEEFLMFIRKPPMFTTVRLNTIISNRDTLIEELSTALLTDYSVKHCPSPLVSVHEELPDVVVVKSHQLPNTVKPLYQEVIVGLQCAVAVLRGSKVYAPGVMGMPNGLSCNDKVSVYADLRGHCKRGWMQEFVGPKTFVGNGILTQTRKDIFNIENPKGVAICMTELIFDCPSIGDILTDARTGLQKGFLQNLPSVLCGHILNPHHEHRILDMCAAPGGKTTHLATLMENKGMVIAIDKSSAKVNQITENARKLGLTNIAAYAFDSVKAVRLVSDQSSNTEPPFEPESFDRILLDAPCSALGQRPQLYNAMRFKELQSFPRLQKKLFNAAYQLLKVGGRMVYSTCTYNVLENEEIVRWALDTFPNLQLVPTAPLLGRPAFRIEGLNDEQCLAMQRFGPGKPTDVNTDTIGFFISCFEKRPCS